MVLHSLEEKERQRMSSRPAYCRTAPVMTVHQTEDPQEDVTCPCHLHQGASLMMCDQLKTWRESKKLAHSGNKMIYSNLNYCEGSPKDSISGNKDKKTVSETCTYQWMEVIKPQYDQSVLYLSWLPLQVHPKRSVIVKGCFSSKALTFLCTANPLCILGVMFWIFV